MLSIISVLQSISPAAMRVKRVPAKPYMAELETAPLVVEDVGAEDAPEPEPLIVAVTVADWTPEGWGA